MRTVGLIVCIAVLLLSTASFAAAAPLAVDTTRLSQGEAALDGATVRFSGEAIGEALKAGGDYRWVNVLADGVAIGVFTPQELVGDIDGYGDWDRTGSIVEVTGVYNVACEQHGGDLDVHATDVRVTRRSIARTHPVRPYKAIVAFLAAAVGIALALRYRTLKRRRER
jgi:hypothetical protein